MRFRIDRGAVLVAICFVYLIGLTRVAAARTWYVSTNGSDTAGNGSQAQPWKTLSHACQSVRTAGDTIQLSSGTFQETSKCYPASGVNITGNGNTGANATILTGTWNDGGYAHFGWVQDGIIVLPQAANGNTISKLILDGNSRALNIGLSTARLPNAAWNDYSNDSRNLTIHDVTARNFACMGIWFNDVDNSTLYNATFTECGTDDPGAVLGGLCIGGMNGGSVHDISLTAVTPASGEGVKFFDRPIINANFYNFNINVKPRSVWAGGGIASAPNNGTGYNGLPWGNAPNLAVEWALVVAQNCTMYNISANATLSLVCSGVNSAHNGTTYTGPGYALRIHNSRVTMSYGYAVELATPCLTLDHNYLSLSPTGTTSASACNDYAPAGTVHQNILIHHCVFDNVNSAVIAESAGNANFNFLNNTVYFGAGSSSVCVLATNPGSAYTGVSMVNNIFSTTSTASPSFTPVRGTNYTGLTVQNNDVNALTASYPTTNATVSGNLGGDPGLSQAGNKPTPYYSVSSATSLVVDAGLIISGITDGYTGAAPDIGAYELPLPWQQYNDTDPGWKYTGSGWTYQAGRKTGDYFNDLHLTNRVGDSASYTFTGTGVAIICEKNSSAGSFSVSIDHGTPTVVNVNSASTLPQQIVFNNNTLSNSPHTVTVILMSGAQMNIDAVIVYSNSAGLISTAPPSFSPGPSTLNGSSAITITDETPGASIYYTLDGTAPTTASIRYNGPIMISADTTIKAMAAALNRANSGVVTATFRVLFNDSDPVWSYTAGVNGNGWAVFSNRGLGDWQNDVHAVLGMGYGVATLTFTGTGVSFITETSSVQGNVSCRIDGGAPTTVNCSSPTLAAQQKVFTVTGLANGTHTLTLTNASSGYLVVDAAEVYGGGIAATPTFSPAGGTYTGSVKVALGDTTPAATIFYTTDGSAPTTASARYAGPFTITKTQTVKAIAVAAGYMNSAVASATYTIH